MTEHMYWVVFCPTKGYGSVTCFVREIGPAPRHAQFEVPVDLEAWQMETVCPCCGSKHSYMVGDLHTFPGPALCTR
jgi:hypothetical protein